MSGDKQNIDKKTKRTIPVFLGRLVYKSALYLLAFAVIVSLTFIFLSQTRAFRVWFYGLVLEKINEELDGRIEASDIKISPLEGLKIEELRIISAGDTLASIKKLSVRYAFMPVFNNYLYIKSITIDNPEIKLLRSSDSTWNYEHLIKASADTNEATPLQWTFDIQKLMIINGKLQIRDSTVQTGNNGKFDLSDAYFDDINLSLKAKADLTKPHYYLEINKFSVTERRSDLDIRAFYLQANIDTGGVSLNNMNLRSNYLTGNLNINLDGINPFETINDSIISNAKLTMTLDADYLQLSLLNKFLDGLPEIDDDIKIFGHLTGNTKHIVLNKFKIEKNKTEISFSGSASNITDSNKAEYQIGIINSHLYDRDFTKIKNALGLNHLNISHTYIEHLEVAGDRRRADMSMKIRSSYANLDGDAKINLKALPDYYAKLKFSNVNPGFLLSDESLQANLTGEIDLKGKGFEPEDITANMFLSLQNSKFTEFSIDELLLKTRVDSNLKIKIDTLLLVLDNTYSDSLIYHFSKKSTLLTSGRLDFGSSYLPEYEFDITLKEFNLASLLRSYMLPQYIDSKLHIDGKGFHPDSLEMQMTSRFDNCMFGNRALMPFGLDIMVERFYDNARHIILNSELFDLELFGEFQIEDFEYFANMQIGELVGFITRNVDSFYKKTDTSTVAQFNPNRRRIPAFKNFTMDLTASLHDLTPIGIAVGQPYLSGNADIDVYIDAVDDRTVIDLRKFSVKNFQYKDNQVKIVVNPTEISTYLDLRLKDSLSYFEKVDLNLITLTRNYIDNLSFEQPKVALTYHNDSLHLNLKSSLNNTVKLATKGNVFFNPGKIKLLLDTASVSLDNLFAWHTYEPIKMNLTSKGLEFEKFIFTRSTSELIDVKGLINTDYAENFNLELRNFPFNQASTFTGGTMHDYLKTLKGKIVSLSLNLKDSLNSPTIQCKFHTNDLISKNKYIGKIKGEANYVNQLLKGLVQITDSSGTKEILRADVVSLPIDLALKIGGKRILPGKPIQINIVANDINLNIANPFLPDIIENLNGQANIKFDIVGVRDSVDYTGFIDIITSRFLATVNNINYNAKGKITIENEKIIFDKIELKNQNDDLRNSLAYVNGTLLMPNLEVQQFDFNIQAKQIKLLSMASKKTMPGLFGDFVIRTKNKGVFFSGTLNEPEIKGDVEVRRARLYMPSLESSTSLSTTTFKYQIKSNNLVVENISGDSLLALLFEGKRRSDSAATESKDLIKKDIHQTKSFADLLKYDLNIWFFMPMQIQMDIGTQLGQITAIVSTRLPSSPIHYYVDPSKKIARIIGDLVLKKNSVFNFIKPFNISGAINFPTGDIDNPQLDLKAVYNGRTTYNESLRNYKVILYIRGTKNRPLITFDYTIDNEPAKGDTAKIREDAIFLLMFGLTKAELESPSNSGGGSFSDIGAQGIASILSRSMTDMLRGTGFITSADIDLQGGSFQNAKLKLSGQLLGMTWKVGGTISDIMSGYEFTAEVPLGLLLFPDKFRSLFLSFMTSYNPSQNVSRNQKNWEIKLKFGDEF